MSTPQATPLNPMIAASDWRKQYRKKRRLDRAAGILMRKSGFLGDTLFIRSLHNEGEYGGYHFLGNLRNIPRFDYFYRCYDG